MASRDRTKSNDDEDVGWVDDVEDDVRPTGLSVLHRITGTIFSLLTARTNTSNAILTPNNVVLSDEDDDDV